MEFNQKYYNYSMKNIPIPSEKLYRTTLIEKVELLIKQMRWKAHLFEGSGKGQSNPLHYVFRSRKCPPQHKDLIAFENDFLKLIKSVTFRKVRNKFQDDLRKDIISIKKSKNIYIFADKTNNLYETDISGYNKLLTESISKTYRKTNNKAYNSINKEAKAIAEGFEIGDRVDCLAKTNAFITLKDHKENFSSNPNCRLINPAKSEIGKVSKLLIENINTKVRDLSSVNQWRDSGAVINWFQNIKNKSKCIFIQFNIEEIYPSISKDLLLKAIDYAKGFVNISNDETKTIMHSRKSLSRKSLLFSGTDV